MTIRRAFSIALALALLGGAAPGRAQELPPPSPLPDSIGQRIIALYNAQTTLRLSGETRLAADTEVRANIAALGGPVLVAGRIEGDLAVINGDLRFDPGAVVTGDVTVVGGALLGQERAIIGGVVRHYPEPLDYRRDGDALVLVQPAPRPSLATGRSFGFGRTDLVIAVRESGYNRVEGLPVSLGARIGLGATNPTVLEGVLIYRSAAGLSLEEGDVGFAVHAEQYVGGRRSARVGLRLYSEITPIERWGLTDRENSLSTFVLHTDHRDHYERRGWSAYTRFARPGGRTDLTVEYRDERHTSVTPRTPWSLLDNDDPWRLQPLIAEGTLRSIAARWQYDTRNDPADPAAGWLIRTTVEQGLGGSLRQPGALPAEDDQPFAQQVDARERFTFAQLDVRRYLRVSPYARLSLRLFASGSVDNSTLPPQRQQTLGGEGSLPGYGTFHFDCGARDRVVVAGTREFYGSYGCDRAAVVQAEFDAGFPFGRRIGRSIGLDTDLGAFRWVAFVNAGRAGTSNPVPNSRRDEEFAADAGIGIRIGALGAYWAFPLDRDADRVNFFVRLGRRF